MENTSIAYWEKRQRYASESNICSNLIAWLTFCSSSSIGLSSQVCTDWPSRTTKFVQIQTFQALQITIWKTSCVWQQPRHKQSRVWDA